MPYSDVEEVSPADVQVDATPLADKLQNTHLATDAIDWFWRNFMPAVAGGGLYKTLIEPLTGDFNRIAANGAAWTHVAESLGKVSNNLTENSATLLAEHWTEGPARDAFREHVEVSWVGGLFIARKSAEYMAKGFEKLAEFSVRAAEKAIELLDRIISRIIKLAVKSVPVAGWIASAVEWIATGFEKFPYLGDVEEILTMIDEVVRLHRTIDELVKSAEGYFLAFGQVVDAVSAIPEINSTHDVIQIGESMTGGVSDMKAQQQEFEQSKQDYERQLRDMEQRALGGGQ